MDAVIGWGLVAFVFTVLILMVYRVFGGVVILAAVVGSFLGCLLVLAMKLILG